jgi:hypothetical protein
MAAATPVELVSLGKKFCLVMRAQALDIGLWLHYNEWPTANNRLILSWRFQQA